MGEISGIKFLPSTLNYAFIFVSFVFFVVAHTKFLPSTLKCVVAGWPVTCNL